MAAGHIHYGSSVHINLHSTNKQITKQMEFIKQIIKFTSYTNKEGWTIDVTKDNKVGIYNPKHELVLFKQLTFNEQKEVMPLIRFIEADIKHNFKLIED